MSRLFPVFVVFVASLLITGAAQAEVKVLTSIKPLQLIAAAVQDGVAVPEVLLSGHDARIEEWKEEQALERTRRLRPDLLGKWED